MESKGENFLSSQKVQTFQINCEDTYRRILGTCWDRSIAISGLSNHERYSTLNTHTDWLVGRSQ